MHSFGPSNVRTHDQGLGSSKASTILHTDLHFMFCHNIEKEPSFLVTLAVDAELVGFGRRPMAATVDEAHHHGVVLLILQVVELCGQHIEQGGLLPQFLTVRWRPEQLH